MVMAARVAHHRGWIDSSELELSIKLLTLFDLPVTVPANMTIADFLPYMKTDKKVKAGKMRFVLPTALGQCAVVSDVTESELHQVFA